MSSNHVDSAVVTADAGYGDNTTFRLELAVRGWRYVAAVKGTTSAYSHDAVPEMMGIRRPGGGPASPATAPSPQACVSSPSPPRVRSKPVTHLAHQQRSCLGEGEQPQRSIGGEGEPVELEDLLEAGGFEQGGIDPATSSGPGRMYPSPSRSASSCPWSVIRSVIRLAADPTQVRAR
jgi:hypothetical protein